MSTWPSLMVGTAEGDLPKLFSLNKGDLSLIFIQRHRKTSKDKRARARNIVENDRHLRTKHPRKHVHTRAQASTRPHAYARARMHAHTSARVRVHARARACVCACLRRACARVCVNSVDCD